MGLWLLSFFFKSSLGRYLGIGLLACILGGGLYAGCKVQAYRLHRAEIEAKAAKLQLKIEEKDRIDADKIHGLSDADLDDLLRNGGVFKKP